MKTPEVPINDDPQLLDVCLNDINVHLLSSLSWLDRAFGKIETFVDGKGREKQTYPAIFVGTKKNRGYLKMFPDSHIGNFSYFQINKDQFDHIRGQGAIHNIEFSIVVWFNFEKVYPNNHRTRTIENVKNDFFNSLDSGSYGSTRIKMNSFIEGAENIYRGFSHSEIDTQFLMRPYGGFRINGSLRYQRSC